MIFSQQPEKIASAPEPASGRASGVSAGPSGSQVLKADAAGPETCQPSDMEPLSELSKPQIGP